ncbi:MAG: cupredoxin domain-containing protein [bacterium]|nr:cupredoxin domain-containing protein [bacterium]
MRMFRYSLYILIGISVGSFLSPVFLHAHEEDGEIFFIEMHDDGYAPNDITISQGDTIVFENKGTNGHWPASNIHPTHRLYPGSDIEKCSTEESGHIFDACKGIAPGESYKFQFIEEGEWRYHDHLSPEIKGAIIVERNQEYIDKHAQNILSRAGMFIKKLGIDIYQFILGLLGKKQIDLDLVEFEANYNDAIARNDVSMFTDKNALYSYVKKYGAGATVKQLHSLEPQYGDCHNAAHEAGRLSYKLVGGEAFQACSAECHSGCYHGATESFFQDKGIKNLDENLSLLCSEGLNSFFSHQCIHGVGHGLMAWSDYDIHEALRICDTLPDGQASCHSGVFMENIVGGLSSEAGHFTEYLSDDPHMPCTVVEEQYKAACYFYQTSRMISLFGGDFSKVAAACASLDLQYQPACFLSMGRDVGGYSRGNPTLGIDYCSTVFGAQERIWCFGGAVQDAFWTSDGQDDALSFCSLLKTEEEKDDCYGVIVGRAVDILVSSEEKNTFCAKMEGGYAEMCRRTLNL